MNDEARNDRRKPWERGDDGTMQIDVDESVILDLLTLRERAKRRKEFDEADRLRDTLLGDYMVHVDDRRRMWWPEGARPRAMSGEEMALAGGSSDFSGSAGGGGGGVVMTHGWTRGPPLQDQVPVDEAKVFAKLVERDNARGAKDFDLADDIMDELTRLGVAFTDDREKTWFAPDSSPRSPAPTWQEGEPDAQWGPDNNLGKRAGDWACPECGANVFASKSVCYRCQCPQPGGAGPRAQDSDDRSSVGGARDYESRDYESDDAPRAREPQSWGARDAPRDSPARRSNDRFPPFQRMQSDTARVDEREVAHLISEREHARKTRDYYTADSLRDLLQNEFGVALDDDAREWWVGERRDRHAAARDDRYAAPRDDRGGGGGGQRRDRFPPFTRMEGDNKPVDEGEVSRLVDEREQARKSRDYATADNLRDVLVAEFGVQMDDDTRQWWVGNRKDNRDSKFGGRARFDNARDNARDGGREGGGNRGRGGGSWKRAPDDSAEIDGSMVLNLIQARDEARSSRDFSTADDIRAVLQEDWGVAVDDDVKEWWVGDRKDNRDRKFGGRDRFGGDDPRGGGGYGQQPQWGARERMGRPDRGGRDGAANRRPFSEPFRRASDDTAGVDEAAVARLISEREDARRSRDYRTADGLRDDLSRQFSVTVDDEERQWWVGERKGNRVRKFNDKRGDAPPPGTWGANRQEDGWGGSEGGGRESWGQFRGGGYERDRRPRGGGRSGSSWGGGAGSGGYRSRDMGGREDMSAEDLGWD